MPSTIRTITELENLLSEPTEGTVEAIRNCPGDLILLGAGGKMGLTLATMAVRAAQLAGEKKRVIAASRFSEAGLEDRFHANDVETIRCDLLNQTELEALPDVPNVIHMLGTKFGTTSQQHMTWAINSFLPGPVCIKYRHSRIVAFSTGNVYPLVPITDRGCSEQTEPNPVGEYGMSALGRERMFEYFSRSHNIPISIIRLNYACELRYGVLVDIALRVFNENPVQLEMGYLNTIWQGDANAMTLQSLPKATSPLFDINVTGLENVSVRAVAQQFGELFKKAPTFEGKEASSALLSDATLAHQLFDAPRVTTDQMIQWIASWIAGGGSTYGKPTRFETRDGVF